MECEKPAVLSLCDYTGNLVAPWLAAGYECWIVDVRHVPGVSRFTLPGEPLVHRAACTHDPFCSCDAGRYVQVGADVRTWLPPVALIRRLVAAFAMPPCTHLANSGNRYKAGKGLAKLMEGLETVEACRRLLDWLEVPWLLENPVGSLSTYWRKPDYTFQPWNFGDAVGDLESKRTCLWTGHGFQMPAFEALVKPDAVKESCWKMAPSPERGDLRSITPPGFAEAVFRANASAERAIASGE